MRSVSLPQTKSNCSKKPSTKRTTKCKPNTQLYFSPHRPKTNRLARVDSQPAQLVPSSVYQFCLPSTKKFGKTGLQVPVPQQLRIIEKYMRGASIRRISEEEDRTRQTVTKIVRSSEVQDYVKKLREEVIALGDEMMASIRFALRHELDGRLAYAMLKDIGVIQPRAQVQLDHERERTKEELQNLEKEWAMKIDLLALERHEVCGTTLPAGFPKKHRRYLKSESSD